MKDLNYSLSLDILEYLGANNIQNICSTSKYHFELCNDVGLCLFELEDIDKMKNYHKRILLKLNFNEYRNNFLFIKELEKSIKIYYYLIYDLNTKLKENMLPHNLHTLILGHVFNEEIENNVLPQGLKNLTLWGYNREFKKNVLPEGLQTLKFGENFNQELKDNVLLPISLKKVALQPFHPQYHYFKNKYDN